MNSISLKKKTLEKLQNVTFRGFGRKNGVYGVDFLIFIQIQLKSATFDMLLIYRHASMNV